LSTRPDLVVFAVVFNIFVSFFLVPLAVTEMKRKTWKKLFVELKEWSHADTSSG
jgi:hypothetical protein